MISDKTLPVDFVRFKAAMLRVYLLMGSAPVGPTTVNRIATYFGALPVVRFGSTETCLQVMGVHPSIAHENRLAAFRMGWNNEYGGTKCGGYLIGRPHPPHNEVFSPNQKPRVSPSFPSSKVL